MENYALRFINHNADTYSEEELQATEKKLEIIRDNQKYTGLTDYHEIQEQLRFCGESLIGTSENKTSSLANLLAGIGCVQSIINIQMKKLKEAYDLEGERIGEIIKEKGL